MMQYDVLIVGGGAAGLMAMKELVSTGYKVCLLEATDRIGGRIKTASGNFNIPVETGAEFVHEKAFLTLELLRQAKLEYIPANGNSIVFRHGVRFDEEDRKEHFNTIIKKVDRIKQDSSLRLFLDRHFPLLEYESLRNSIQQFSESFLLADSDASMFALRHEVVYQNQLQNRIVGGYSLLIKYLEDECTHHSSHILTNCPVRRVKYDESSAEIWTTNKRYFKAAKVIICVPLSVLQAGYINFDPPLTDHSIAFSRIRFGSVIKFMLQFQKSFWADLANEVGFIFTDELVPTWWTQHPLETPLLTGWLGGPSAKQATALSENVLLDRALGSLANVFQLEKRALATLLLQHKIVCWGNRPFIGGGYSYNIIGSDGAKRILNLPIKNTIYFAGEACHSGPLQGTVEAALASGKRVAKCISGLEL